ncbi:glutaredoxin family protein [Pseudomonadales bacterium]|nr:glutaredoxin family protein [Pseudomonadales bacterium]
MAPSAFANSTLTIPMTSLTLYMTEHCALCEEVLDMLFAMPAMQGITLNTIDIAMNDALVEAYGVRIPVLKVGDAELGAPIDAQTLQAWLQHNCQ